MPREQRRLSSYAVELVTDDYWFPADELGTCDLRCLGVLLKVDRLQPEGCGGF